MVCCYGMKTMSYRTTFALDKGTAGRLKRLSGLWQTSQAEVVRRAVAMADEAEAASDHPTAALRALHDSGRLVAREEAEEYLASLQKERESLRGNT